MLSALREAKSLKGRKTRREVLAHTSFPEAETGTRALSLAILLLPAN